jgi:hypothetical protein
MTPSKRRKKVAVRERNYKHVGDIKRKGHCLLCLTKEKLTFHHRQPKKKKNDIQRLASQGLSIGNIDKEIAKCDLLCEECHREVHQRIGLRKYNKFIRFLRNRKKI